MKTQTKSFLTVVLFLMSGLSYMVYSHARGITGDTRKGPYPGCSCHNYSSAVNVTINGPDTLTADQTADYNVTIAKGPLAAAGVDIAASTGTLIAGSGLKLQYSELTQSSPKTPTGGVVTFQFKYTAPSSSGPQTLYATGNSINYNGSASGDAWNYAPNKSLTIVSTTGIINEKLVTGFKLKQNYPNPFNPTTKISYQIPHESKVVIKVYNILGKEVSTLVNNNEAAGKHSVNFDGSNLSSGIYLYDIAAGNFTEVRKMMLLK